MDVTLHANAYSVDARGIEAIPPQPLPEAAVHHLVIEVRADRVTVTVDNAPPTVIALPSHAARTVGGGTGLYAHRALDTSPRLTFSNLTIN